MKRELCFLHAGAGGCQRHTSTTCSCSRRGSHTRCVRDSCPQRHRRLQRSILLEAQCKMIPSPRTPLSGQAERGRTGQSMHGASEQSLNSTSGVCRNMGSAGHSQQDLFQPPIWSSGVIPSTHSSDRTEQEDCSQGEVSG